MKREETAILGGGCFWCLEAVFQEVPGVQAVESGYAGGTQDHPTYKQVCSGTTGHAEVVRVRFDPDRVSYPELLSLFFATHDPTQKDRQGNDVGTQYRSAIMPADAEQERLAREAIDTQERSGLWPAPVVTTVEPGVTFWPAEDEHQDFYVRNQGQPYCLTIIDPKLEKARRVLDARAHS